MAGEGKFLALGLALIVVTGIIASVSAYAYFAEPRSYATSGGGVITNTTRTTTSAQVNVPVHNSYWMGNIGAGVGSTVPNPPSQNATNTVKLHHPKRT